VLSDERVLAAAATNLMHRFFASTDHGLLRAHLQLPRTVPTQPSDGQQPPAAGSTRAYPPTRGAGYLADAALRRALESHAVARAISHYQRRGWTVRDVGATEPYDLDLIHRDDRRVRHVEVKGSSQDIETVELTVGEVKHSHLPVPCDLFLVGNIQYSPTTNVGYLTWGGTVRVWPDWTAEESHLKPTRYRYQLPTRGNNVRTGDEASPAPSHLGTKTGQIDSTP
jgi:hypothetical protein